MEEIPIGPNRCSSCGGEYGEHDEDCRYMAPKTQSVDPINQAVIVKIAKRAEAGLKKYGVGPDRKDLTRRQWLQHAQEEAMDLAVYLERLIQEEDRIPEKTAAFESWATRP